jgi:16S rRNA A1518/A1519 N6-dimethyltransferase RsmA/KsgA/DIM1 with predicted DNA glycosylase/AP lyase activity
VTAVEIDRDLASDLRAAACRTSPSSRAIFSSCADRTPVRARLRVAGNLPYNVASPILFTLVDWFGDAAPCRRDADAAARSRRPAGGGAGTREYGVLTC